MALVARFGNRGADRTLRLVGAAAMACALATVANAQSASRVLPVYYVPADTVSVVIELDAPLGTAAVGVEDTPPAGWTVSAVSHSGALDTQSGKVKWGPFFDPSIPASVSYDATPPPSASVAGCFVGSALFDTTEVTITGSECVAGPVPASSTWAALVLGLCLVIAGTVVGGDRSRARWGMR